MKFTSKTVAAATVSGGRTDIIYWHDLVKGFGLRVRLGGDGRVRKNFVVQYRAKGRRTRRMGLGDVEVRPLDAALAEAKQILGKVAGGGDPQGELRAEQQRQNGVGTFKAIVDLYLATKQREVRPNTYRELERYLTKAFKPLHATPVDQIVRRDVATRLTKIAAEVSPATAARARDALSAMFTWAMGEGLAESNPVVGTNAPKAPKSRDRVLSDQELAAIWRAAGDDQFGKIVKLLITLGQRRAEIGGMKWPEIGTDGIWRLPPERTKNGHGHALPLMPMALDIIATVPQIEGRDNLFGAHGGRFTDWGRKVDLDTRLATQVAPWRLHDIRRSVATGMADIGIAPHIIEVVLNHRSGHKAGIAGVYNKSSYVREVRAALAAWERYIGLITDRDLHAAHQAYLTHGDEQVRETACNAFRDAITAGGGRWKDYVRALVEGERPKVLAFQTA
jgi:integrase